jgi:hypothetical protein
MKLPSWTKPVFEFLAGAAMTAAGASHWVDGIGPELTVAGVCAMTAALSPYLTVTQTQDVVEAVEDAEK